MADVKARVSRVTEKAREESLANGNKREKARFARLTKSEKREWRDALQRAVAKAKNTTVAKALAGQKLSRNQRFKVERISRLEAEMLRLMDVSDDGIELQAGKPIIAAAAALSVAYAAHKFGTTCDSVSEGVNTLNGAMKNFIENTKKYGSILWKPAAIGVAVWLLCNYGHVLPLVAAVVATVGVYLPEIAGMIKSFAPKGVRLQNGGVSLTSELLTMMCTCWVPGKDTKSVTGEFMKRVSNFNKAKDGMEGFVKGVLDLAEKFINFILRRNEGNRITFSQKKDAYDQWRHRVIAAVKEMAENPTMPIEDIRRIKELQIEGFGFHEVLATVESKRDLSQWMEKLSLALAPHEGAIKAETNLRPLPYCIMIGGRTGVGKTTLLRFIASTILLLSGECTAENALGNLWQKGTSEYFNGYIGQKCYVMDDCFQVKAKPGDMDSEAMQTIRMVGNWSMPLNFADLMSKGKIYFDSPLIIGTTNEMNVVAAWDEFITQPQALVRRFQTSVWVDVTPEFKTGEGRFDFEKVQGLFKSSIRAVERLSVEMKAKGERPTVSQIFDLLPWHIWTLVPHGFDRSDIGTVPIPGGLRSVVETAADAIKSRKKANREEIDDIQSLLRIIGDATKEGVELEAGLNSFSVNAEEFTPSKVDPEIVSLHSSQCEKVDDTDRMFEEFRRKMKDPSYADYVRETLKERVHLWSMEAEAAHHEAMDSIGAKIERWFERVCAQHPIVGDVVEIVATVGMCFLIGMAIGILCNIILGLVGAVSTLIGYVARAFGIGRKRDNVDLQSNERPPPPVRVDSKHMDLASFNDVKVTAQVGVPPNEDVYDNIYNNGLKCYTDDWIVGQFLGLGEDVYLFPKHFIAAIEALNPETVLYFQSAKSGMKSSMSREDFLRLKREVLPRHDIAAVSFGASFMKANRNIIKYFLTQHEQKSVLRGGNTGVRLDVANLKKNGGLSQKTHYSPTCYYHGGATDYENGYSLAGLVRYTAPTMPGDCGAPLSLADNRHFGSRCIMGIHSAGKDHLHGRQGFATAVTQEVARELHNRLSSYKDPYAACVVPGEVDVPEGEARVELQTQTEKLGLTGGSVELIGTLVNPVNISTKSTLKVSELGRDQVFGPCPTAPAVLRAKEVDGVMVEPMVQGLKAYQSSLLYRDPSDLEPIVNLAMKRHWEVTKHHTRDLLTFPEAIVPPENMKLKPINRHTSAGWKYQQYVSAKTPGKTAFFGKEGPIEMDEGNDAFRVLKEDTRLIVHSANRGERLGHLCTDFLKDELRPLEKVETLKTRVISGTPLDYTIAVRMYFGAFLAAMFDTYVANGMAPGLNHYKEWADLVHNLQEVSGRNQDGDFDLKVFDGDFSRFDASEQPWVHSAILAYVNKWYRHNNPRWRQEDETARNVLWLDLVHSRHICGVGSSLKYVVQWHKSLPSGHPLTTMVNSMYSLITLTGCYVRCTGDLLHMWDNVRIVTFGDDSIVSVSDSVCDDFNQVNVAPIMMEVFGLTYTPGNKGGVFVPYTNIEDVTFLKRSFRKDDTVFNRLTNTGRNLGWVGTLAMESFLYTPYWYKNSRTPTQEMQTRLEQCLCELCLYPQHVWDEIYVQLEQWCVRNGVPLPLGSREAVRDYVQTRFDVWF
jgi:flagellar biosynthesis GTPase FlhF